MYKSAKFRSGGDVKSSKRAIVEDEGDDEIEAGPELPPDKDEGLDDDDDEGRFFGGGITNKTSEVLDFLDERDKDELGVKLIALNTEFGER